MPSQPTSWSFALLCACALAGPAVAQDRAAAPAARAAFATPLAAAELERHRGGAQVVTNDVTLAGTTADNTAHHVTTGNNAISAGSFANMSGIPVVIQNSGANVLIQNALTVHLQLE